MTAAPRFVKATFFQNAETTLYQVMSYVFISLHTILRHFNKSSVALKTIAFVIYIYINTYICIFFINHLVDNKFIIYNLKRRAEQKALIIEIDVCSKNLQVNKSLALKVLCTYILLHNSYIYI